MRPRFYLAFEHDPSDRRLPAASRPRRPCCADFGQDQPSPQRLVLGRRLGLEVRATRGVKSVAERPERIALTGLRGPQGLFSATGSIPFQPRADVVCCAFPRLLGWHCGVFAQDHAATFGQATPAHAKLHYEGGRRRPGGCRGDERQTHAIDRTKAKLRLPPISTRYPVPAGSASRPCPTLYPPSIHAPQTGMNVDKARETL
jgi:hypothetical protein